MRVLGIESTAHTFGASVLEDDAILSNESSSYSNEEGGLVPSELSEHHYRQCKPIVEQALANADTSITDIDVIVYSRSPGIGNALRIGCVVAKSLSMHYDIPLVGVNHCIAHLEIGRLVCDADDPVLLYVSGANTQVISYYNGKYRVMGETLDIGLGNFLDKFARDLDLGFPGGPKVEELAAQSDTYVELPYVVKGMDTSYGGLQTNLREKIQSGEYDKEDLCHSVQETAFAMIVEVAERAMANVGKDELVLGGGVACNERLQEMCRVMCDDRCATSYCPDSEYLVDNAAMIAWTGKLMYDAGESRTVEEADVDPEERTDDVDVTWR